MKKRFDGSKVTPLREAKGLTKTYLANLLGISQQSMSDIELNRNKSEVKNFVVTGLAKIFEVSEDYFFEDEDKINYNLKSNGKNRKKYKQAFEKSGQTVSELLEICGSKVEVFYDDYIDAREFLAWKGDAEVIRIETSLEKTESKTYRDDVLIDEDVQVEPVIVLVVKLD